MDILLDFHGRPFSPRAALAYIDACSPARPMFVEEPIQPGDHVAMAQIAQLAKCPIATGERLITHREYEDLCGLRAVTYVQPDLCHCGGFTVGKQIAATAATFGIGVCPHNPMGPIAGAVGLHFAAAVPNFTILEEITGGCRGTPMSCRRRSAASMAIGSCRPRPASAWRSMKKSPRSTRSSRSRLRRWRRCCGGMAPSPIGDITMKTVLITGATGNIGRKLRAHLEATGKYALRLLCLNPGNDPTVHTADLTPSIQDWAAEFAGVDTVLHVAADPSPRASWARIQSRNIDLC